MPTATTTAVSSPAVISLKASSKPSSSATSTAATLRSLYPRAARAFLQRNVALTHSLLSSAFSILPPPLTAAHDPLASHRKKWDILRITFETTLYASPPSSQDPEHLPPSLRANLMLSPEPLIATLHNRSLQLFTPASPPQKPTSAFLPAQILVTLVLASLKLECTDVGRGMIEDWLARHGQEGDADDAPGYAKVLELYCLHVLPRLEDWEYAEDFLQYERELSPDVRRNMISSLRKFRAEALASRRPPSPKSMPQPTFDPSPSSSRPPSPTHSDTSASSSSSTSTHTATPGTPRAGSTFGSARVRSLAVLTPIPNSASSQSIASTATSRTVTPNSSQRSTAAKARPSPRANGSAHALPRPPRAHSFEVPATTRPPSTLALIRSSVDALLHSASRSKVFAFLLVCIALPLLSFVFRIRQRRIAGAGSGAGGGTAQEVRRRLRNSEGGGPGSMFGKLWDETRRAVGDTVRMAGRGLV